MKNKDLYCLKIQGFDYSPVIQKLSWSLLQFLLLHQTSNQHHLCLKSEWILKLMFQQDWQVFQSFRLCNEQQILFKHLLQLDMCLKTTLQLYNSLTTTKDCWAATLGHYGTVNPWDRQSSVPRKCCLAQNYTP